MFLSGRKPQVRFRGARAPQQDAGTKKPLIYKAFGHTKKADTFWGICLLYVRGLFFFCGLYLIDDHAQAIQDAAIEGINQCGLGEAKD